MVATGCVPPGSAGEQDAGKGKPATAQASATAATFTPSPDIMKTPFEDDFNRPGVPASAATPTTSASAGAASSATAATSASAGASAAASASGASAATSASTAPGSSATSPSGTPNELGPDWMTTGPNWHIEGGRLCAEHAKNHGVWLKRVLPINARIEFDATSQSPDGDLKAEYWGDGRSFATSLSYTNATSYLTIFGGWHNKFHVLARLNEHGNDRQEITITPDSDDPREKPAMAGQSYHFKVERADGKTVKWWVDGNEMLTWVDTAPLMGVGHDHFGFNDWDVKLCFDNVKVVPLP